jgi:exopolysaccharide biosynthesis polyprenyl glycosylphosphotransferase
MAYIQTQRAVHQPRPHQPPPVAQRAPVNTRQIRPWVYRGKPAGYLLAIDCLCLLGSMVVLWPPDVPQLLGLVAMLSFFAGVGKLYRSRLALSILDDLPYVVGGVLSYLLVELSADSLIGSSEPRWGTARQLALLLVLVVVSRGLAYSAVRSARRAGRIRHRVLILGAGHVGTRLAQTLQQHREYGLDPVGYWDGNPRTHNAAELGAPVFGPADRLSDLIQDFSVDLVIIAFSRAPESQLIDVLRTCDRLHCEIYLVPRLFELHTITRDMDNIWGIPLAHIRRAAYRTWPWRLKRLMDFVVAALALLLLLPVMAVCALGVRLEGGRGVIFRQERVGLDGRPLTVLKFRSLTPANDHDSATTWNVSNDQRVGRVGKFLRKSSLDELPQLWNVLTGEMSLVGPRPERPHFVDRFSQSIPRYSSRHRVPAGMTGWAQVHGLRGDTSIEERAVFDNSYVENWSLWGDIKIIIRTVQQVFARHS